MYPFELFMFSLILKGRNDVEILVYFRKISSSFVLCALNEEKIPNLIGRRMVADLDDASGCFVLVQQTQIEPAL